MEYLTDDETLSALWRQRGGSTFHKRNAEEAVIEARIAAQKKARLAQQGGLPAFNYDGDLIRNARIAGRYGQGD